MPTAIITQWTSFSPRALMRCANLTFEAILRDISHHNIIVSKKIDTINKVGVVPLSASSGNNTVILSALLLNISTTVVNQTR